MQSQTLRSAPVGLFHARSRTQKTEIRNLHQWQHWKHHPHCQGSIQPASCPPRHEFLAGFSNFAPGLNSFSGVALVDCGPRFPMSLVAAERFPISTLPGAWRCRTTSPTASWRWFWMPCTWRASRRMPRCCGTPRRSRRPLCTAKAGNDV